MPRWSKQDDATVAAIAACRERPGAGSAWPAADLPDRGRLTGPQVKDRWHAIKHKFSSAMADVSAPVPAAAPAPARGARRPRRQTPMRARAEAVGIEHQPTPAGQREIVADPDASPAAVALARHVIKKQKIAMHQIVTRAERTSVKLAQLAKLRKEIQAEMEMQQEAQPSNCPGLAAQVDNIQRLRLWNVAAQAEAEAAACGGFSRWLKKKKIMWRELRRRKRLKRASDHASQQLAASLNQQAAGTVVATMRKSGGGIEAPSWNMNYNDVACSYRGGVEPQQPRSHHMNRYLQVQSFEHEVRRLASTEFEGDESAAIARIRADIEKHRPGFFQFGDWGKWPSFAGHVDELVENHHANRLFFPRPETAHLWPRTSGCFFSCDKCRCG